MAFHIDAKRLVSAVTHTLGVLLGPDEATVELMIRDDSGAALKVVGRNAASDLVGYDVQLVEPQRSQTVHVTMAKEDLRHADHKTRIELVDKVFIRSRLAAQLVIVNFGVELPKIETAKKQAPPSASFGSNVSEAELVAAGLMKPTQTAKQPNGKAIEYVYDPSRVAPGTSLDDMIAAGLAKPPAPIKVYRAEMGYGDQLRARAAKEAALTMQRIIEATKKETEAAIAQIKVEEEKKAIDDLLEGKKDKTDETSTEEFRRPTQPAPKPFPKPEHKSNVPALKGVVGRRSPTKAF